MLFSVDTRDLPTLDSFSSQGISAQGNSIVTQTPANKQLIFLFLIILLDLYVSSSQGHSRKNIQNLRDMVSCLPIIESAIIINAYYFYKLEGNPQPSNP